WGAIGYTFQSHAGSVGTPPTTSTGLQDGNWLLGLAGGQNRLFTNSLTAKAGGGQTGATVIPANMEMVQFDTVASSGDSAGLPFCQASVLLFIINNGANSMNVFANASNNPLTAALDTIDGNSNSTALAIASKTKSTLICAKNGTWFH